MQSLVNLAGDVPQVSGINKQTNKQTKNLYFSKHHIIKKMKSLISHLSTIEDSIASQYAIQQRRHYYSGKTKLSLSYNVSVILSYKEWTFE